MKRRKTFGTTRAGGVHTKQQWLTFHPLQMIGNLRLATVSIYQLMPPVKVVKDERLLARVAFEKWGLLPPEIFPADSSALIVDPLLTARVSGQFPIRLEVVFVQFLGVVGLGLEDLVNFPRECL